MLKQFRINLREKDLVNLFQALDQDMDGEIRYDEFLLAIRGPMAESRRKVVNEVFSSLDKDRSGFISVGDLHKCYDANKHPEVQRKTRGQDDLFEEFADGIDAYYRVKGFSDGKISAEEFLEFYSFVSFAIRSDDIFNQILTSCFRPISQAQTGRSGAHIKTESRAGDRSPYSSTHRKGEAFQESPDRYGISGNYGYKRDSEYQRDEVKSSAGRSRHTESKHEESRHTDSRQSESRYGSRRDPDEVSHKSYKANSPTDNLASPSRKDSPASFLRQLLLKRGPKTVIQLRRQFKMMDDNNDGCISFPEFAKGLRDFGLNMSESDMKSLFISIDKHATQKISIDDLCREIVGVMNPSRIAIVDEVFDKLDKSKNGKVSITDIKQTFTAKGHPDVKNASRTQDEVIAEFFNTLEIHMVSRSFKKDQRLSKDDFRTYYTNISAFYHSDEEFEMMLRNCWRLPANPSSLPMRKP